MSSPPLASGMAFASSLHPDARAGDVYVSVYSPSGEQGQVPNEIPPLPPYPAKEPLIYHLVVPRGLVLTECCPTTLLDLLVAHTPLSEDVLVELCRFGACYATIGHTGPSVSPRPPRVDMEILLQPIPSDLPVYARIHARPRRHRPLWPLRMLYDDGSLVIVDKPAGIPVQPSVDNVIENTRVEAEKVLTASRVSPEVGDKIAIWVTTRVDVGTSGCLCFSRSREGVVAANAALRKAHKRYLCLTRNRPDLGELRYWLRKKPRLGRGVMLEPLVKEWCEGDDDESGGSDWCRGQLMIEGVKQVGNEAWESIVLLETGRVHQIRLMFAASGWWIFGDKKYEGVGGNGRIDAGGVLGDSSDKHGLHVTQLRLEWNGETLVVDAGPAWWHQSHGQNLGTS
jgi:23S rRNA-/tRNA-specific pseudouridylate synthase